MIAFGLGPVALLVWALLGATAGWYSVRWSPVRRVVVRKVARP